MMEKVAQPELENFQGGVVFQLCKGRGLCERLQLSKRSFPSLTGIGDTFIGGHQGKNEGLKKEEKKGRHYVSAKGTFWTAHTFFSPLGDDECIRDS